MCELIRPEPSQRDALLQMLAIALDVACASITFSVLGDDATPVEVNEHKWEAICYVLHRCPSLLAKAKPDQAKALLESTLEHLAVEQQRFQLEKLVEG
jgi:hypothetical protein